ALPSLSLYPHVAACDRGHDDQQQEPPRVGETAQTHQPPPDQPRLRLTTKRTVSAIQSESVRRTRCPAPAFRNPVATACRCSRAAAPNFFRNSAEVRTARCLPLSGSDRVTVPTSGSSTSRGARTSTPSRSCRADNARTGRGHCWWPRKSEITTARPRLRGGLRNCSTASARSPRVPSDARGVSATLRTRLLLCASPPRGGMRVVVSPFVINAPIR